MCLSSTWSATWQLCCTEPPGIVDRNCYEGGAAKGKGSRLDCLCLGVWNCICICICIWSCIRGWRCV